MHDVIQQGLESLALHNITARDVLMFCAGTLVYVLAAVWLAVAVWRQARISLATTVRIIVMCAAALVVAKVLNQIVMDPRPYIVTHTKALISASHDNGFPSDHVLLAAALATSVAWFERRLVVPFAAAAVLVALGRLGVGAHHTEDVVGSIVIVLLAALAVARLRFPSGWDAPVLTARRQEREPEPASRTTTRTTR